MTNVKKTSKRASKNAKPVNHPVALVNVQHETHDAFEVFVANYQKNWVERVAFQINKDEAVDTLRDHCRDMSNERTMRFLHSVNFDPSWLNRSVQDGSRVDEKAVARLAIIADYIDSGFTNSRVVAQYVTWIVTTLTNFANANKSATQDDLNTCFSRELRTKDKSVDSLVMRNALVFGSHKRHSGMTLSSMIGLGMLKKENDCFVLNTESVALKKYLARFPVNI